LFVVFLGDLVDSYLLYASAALAAMGVVASVLAFVFRMRLRKLTAVSRNAEATVFNRTFMVFDPYEKKTILHRFLPLLIMMPFIGAMALGMMLLLLVSSGLLLALLVVVVSVGLMTVGESFEAYTESKLLIRAMKNGDRLGMGDMRLLEVVKMILPRLTFYYVVLAVFLFVLAAVFPFAWTDVLLYSVMLFSFAIQVGSIGGPAGWMASLGLYALIIVGLLVLVTLVKNRLFGYRLESSGVKQHGSVRRWCDYGRARMPETSSDEQGKAKN
jgi:hypothetical protein